MPNRLTGKTILVVGAGGNLGPTWVGALLAEGATVWGVGLGATTDPHLQELDQQWPGFLVRAELDISHEISLPSLLSSLGASSDTAAIDGLLLNAGIDSIPGTGKTSLMEYDRAEWERIFGVNVFGLVDALNAVVPALANPSSVVMMGSLYGLVSPKPALYDHFNGGQGSIKHPAYGASKAALIAIAKQYGTHLAHDGVRVNMLTLGGVAAGQDQEFVDKFVSHVPQAQMLSRNDVIGAMVFLLSDDSRAMTGQNVVVDGGFTAW